MCCIHGICILAPGANVSANMIFHPVEISLFQNISQEYPGLEQEQEPTKIVFLFNVKPNVKHHEKQAEKEETLPKDKMVSWSDYHASKQQQRNWKPPISFYFHHFKMKLNQLP